MSKTAFITGAGGYIGRETALKLAKNGVNIAVCDINAETVEKTVSEIIGGSAKGYIADVTNPRDVENTMNNVVKDFNSLDIMVHVAGGSARIAGAGAEYRKLCDQEDYVIDAVLKVNLYGAIYTSRSAAKIMREQGTGGAIVLFSSIVGVNGLTLCAEYAAAKAGVVGLSKSLTRSVRLTQIF